MKATLRGTEIFFDIAGMQIEPNGRDLIEKPVLFLIHGGPGGNHVRFKYDTIDLQKYAQLVFIDQRGCGFSKKTKKSDYTLENNIEDIEALRKHLGLDKICVLGVSYGGMVAQGYAIRYSKHVEKLILVVTAPSYRFLEDAKENLQKVGTPEQIRICDEYLWKGKFPSKKSMNHYFAVMDSLYSYNKMPRKEYSFKNLKSFKSHELFSYDVLNAGFGGFLRKFDFIPKLKKITCPTLILAGKNDWICSYKQSQIIAKHIKHSILKIFPRCGHAIGADANKKYIGEVARFLRM